MSEISSQPRSHTNLVRLLPLLKPYKRQIFFALLALLCSSLATLAVPLTVRRVVDQGMSADGKMLLDGSFTLMLAIVTVLAISSAVRYYFVSWLGDRVVMDLRSRLFNHLLTLSPAFYDTQRVGDVVSRLNSDTSMIRSAFSSSASTALRNFVMLVGAMIMMVVSSPFLSGLATLAIPVIVLPLVIFGRRVRHLSRITQDKFGFAAAFAQERIGAVAAVQANVQEQATMNEYMDATSIAFSAAMKRSYARALLTALTILVALGSVVALLWVGANSIISGAMTPGVLSQFVIYAILAASSLGQLSEVWGEVQHAAGAAERVSEVLAHQSHILAPVTPTPLPKTVKGALSFHKVDFAYPSRPGHPSLHQVTLALKPGEVTAIVGPSGAGKTTLFALAQRFYDPQRGQITLDGIDIKQFDPKVLRTQIAIVPQETTIFSGSVLDNIRFGAPGASREEALVAAEAAHVKDFSERLPKGFDTEVGERGVTLSGGQRQRIAIARALLRNAPILLLDEATSALDAESESLVQQALERLTKGRTTLVIAHRLATVRNAKSIVLLDGGEIMARGTHSELVKKNALYAKLAKLQFSVPSI